MVILTRTRDENSVRHDKRGKGGREAHYYHKIMKRDLAALRTAAHYGRVARDLSPWSMRYACLTGQIDSPAMTEQGRYRAFAKGDTGFIYVPISFKGISVLTNAPSVIVTA